METDGVDELEAALRRKGEVAIDLEERGTKKGTPPKPSESGDIRQLHSPGVVPPPDHAVGPGGPS